MRTGLVMPATPSAKSVLTQSMIVSFVMINLWSQDALASIHVHRRAISLKSVLVSLAILHAIIVQEQWTQCVVNAQLVTILLRQHVIQSAIHPCSRTIQLAHVNYVPIIVTNARWFQIAKNVRPAIDKCQILAKERCSLDLMVKFSSIWRWMLLSQI
jgi:hypothetical protein